MGEGTSSGTESRDKNIRLGKYLRREVRAEFKRIAYQIKFLTLFDPGSIRELESFAVAEPLQRFFETAYGQNSGLTQPAVNDMNTMLAISAAAGKSVRRSLKLIRRRLRKDICRLVEKVQLLRALDTSFDAEMEALGLLPALEMIARWHETRGEETL